MLIRLLSVLLILSWNLVFVRGELAACESCTIPRLGRDEGARVQSADKKWFFKYLYEEQNWHEKDAREAHALHHDGHHFHDKTKEHFYHMTLGRQVSEDLTVMGEMPYVVRESLEVDDHHILGTEQKSEGPGDMHLIGLYRLADAAGGRFSLAGGLKLPTGATNEKNSVGTLFEPEMQPGTGSVDYLLGGVFERQAGRWELIANTVYAIRTEGDQDFEFGDLSSTSVMVDYLLNPDSSAFQTKIGLDANIQFEQKQRDDGVKVADSGGTTLLLGPVLGVQANERLALMGSFLLPAYQDLGGVHQELDFTWTLGGKFVW